MLSEKGLVGVWRLVAHYYLEDDGSISEGPMGDRAEGLLIYHEEGYMSASLMRTGPSTGAGYLGSTDDYLGYSGRWHVRGDTVVHEVAVASHARVVNTEQVREARLEDDGLRLLRRLGGPHDWVVMDWRRTPAPRTDGGTP